MSDPFDLGRYVDAQDAGGTHDQALAELRRGRKTSHWMWFVFPQIAGLGRSGMDRTYAIRSLDEARAYLAHPLLGPRLREAAGVAARADAASAGELMGGIDALKLRSSMTLFARADPAEPEFRAVLDRWFDGVEDDLTVARL
ncbi:DUF1810 domain-containing protein [Frigoribacterium sp. CFBP 8759]|jgi:uncharacterized protein (DUF1810 family)|uniref:DUF1810 domain-containing protein n=1 Tax=Frigoribacterium TaxID=96492 RepID=UPI0006F8362B|nr:MULTISPECIES: DUF1810 domain-containing protein [Frigoribacterium]KQM29451.1 calpastatin [Frigoribacterium sp. Leaf8]MBD8484893.1 DUF1810 domain-containing protein [Frigoribacterium sp. CFBP 8759]NQW87814.1 DUF1810 domain-containing protein [Frigoribacterium sp. VKM Ac-2860]NQX09377.1 DUF1810 domain-containing protein [Frigoribacterium sp. VKM Ac-2859]ROS52324.1 uncharacterized protein (DUF1810 family) [Frigoribacterium sp. PhB118]